MRINLRQTKPMKRDLVYTTDDGRLRAFDPTRVFAPSPHQNRQFAPPVEKVGLELVKQWSQEYPRCALQPQHPAAPQKRRTGQPHSTPADFGKHVATNKKW